MPSDVNRQISALVMGAIFALLSALAPPAPMAVAQDTSAVTAGGGIYENADKEAEEISERAEELREKADALRMQAENDETEAERLEGRVKQLEAKVEELEKRADEQAEKEAKRLDKEAEALDEIAEDFRDSAEDAEEEAEELERRVDLVGQLGDALGDIAGRWECKNEMDFAKSHDGMDDNKKNIDVEKSEQNNILRSRYEIFPNYRHAVRSDGIIEYVFSRKKESYEFIITAARRYSGTVNGSWKIYQEKGKIINSFGRERGSINISKLEIVEQSVEFHYLIRRNKPVPNWKSDPDLEAEMRKMTSDVAEIFPGLTGQWESGGKSSLIDFSWWEKHCEKG